MSANDTTEPKPNDGDRSDVPPGYRRVDTDGLGEHWLHDETGLSVELERWARYRHARATSIDHFEYRLVVRPDGPDSEGECVDRTTVGYDTGANADRPIEMTREWLRAHPDGEVDG